MAHPSISGHPAEQKRYDNTSLHALMALTRQVLLSVDVDRQVVVEHVIGVVQEGQHAHGDHQLVRAEVEGAGELVLVRAGVL